MHEGKELADFMKKKNMEARGEVALEAEEDGNQLKDAPRSINQDSVTDDLRAARALTIFRVILNLMFIIPLAAVTIGLVGYILVKFIPALIYFAKKFIILLFQIQ